MTRCDAGGLQVTCLKHVGTIQNSLEGMGGSSMFSEVQLEAASTRYAQGQ